MSEKLKKLNDTLKALVKERQAIKEDQDSEEEAIKMALLVSGLDNFQSGIDSLVKSNSDTVEAIRSIKIDPPTVPPVTIPEIKVPDIKVNVPEIKLPEINVPEPKVTVNLPEIKVPEANVKVQLPEMPELNVQIPEEMKISGDVGLRDVDKKNPLPVTLLDLEGKPVSFGSSGGRSAPKEVGIKDSSGTVVNPAEMGTVSSKNSSSTAIDNGSNFTGEWEDWSKYEVVNVAVKTDQNGYYEVQFSPDGTNVDSTLTRYYRTANINPPQSFKITRKYGRVVFYNNSGSNQTYFRFQTMLGGEVLLSTPIDTVMSQNYPAIAVRPTEFHSEVALGLRQGVTTWNKFGFNTDIDTGTEAIQSWGGAFQFSTTGETLSIVSTSTNDASAGTGVRSIVVYGVDANWNPQIEVFTMNGTTPVVSTSTWIGISRVAVYLSGSGMTNAGTITITGVTTGFIKGQIPLGIGVSQHLFFYIASNHQFLVRWLHFNVLKTGSGAKPEITFLGQVYSAVNNTIQEVYRGQLDVAVSNDIDVNTFLPFPIGEKSILYFTATTDTDNTSVSGRFSGELFKDVDA